MRLDHRQQFSVKGLIPFDFFALEFSMAEKRGHCEQVFHSHGGQIPSDEMVIQGLVVFDCILTIWDFH